MILVNVPRTWPEVESGLRTAEEVTLGQWSRITDEALETYADVIVGVYKHEVVSVFDIESWTRNPEDDRITFTGTPSDTWAHLIGGPNPGPRWAQGHARPIKYLDTAEVEGPSR